MTDTEMSSQPISDRDLEAIKAKQSILIEQKSKIEDIFDSNFSGSKNIDKFEVTGNSLSWLFEGDNSEPREVENLINAVFNICINYNHSVRSELKQEDIGSEVIDLLEYIVVNHDTELNRQANRSSKGSDWWSNVSTTVSYRNGVVLSHEFTIDMDEKVTISNDIYSSHQLANHILQQTKSARNIIGEDVLEEVNKDILEDAKDTIEDIIEEVDRYEDSEDSDVDGNISNVTEGDE